ncbi:acetate kinase [Streptomyces sp. SID3343]|uniref:acetate kinase n=1 Tax=Streptomyces sp. SID3343 TaxID=2690260 RepID=UPI00235124DC|nr:acetate kinase [Streptomyces sp. SID3343]
MVAPTSPARSGLIPGCTRGSSPYARWRPCTRTARSPASTRSASCALNFLPSPASTPPSTTRFSAEASTYALPQEWRARWGLRRYGFHGLSHAYASARASELTDLDATSARVVSCHLGAGASLAAVRGGVSVDTTMGFTPTEGLVMATRAGDLDPGMLVWLQRNGVELDRLENVLEHEAGLSALAGHGGDMRAIRVDADAGDLRARLARAIYAYRVRTGIAAMAAAMGGMDILVFTGGVGEHDDGVRAQAVAELGFLGVGLDPGANARAVGDAEIGASDAPVRTVVVTAREDVWIARETRGVSG